MPDNKLKQLIKQYNQLKKDAKELDEVYIVEYFKKHFEKYPNIQSIHLFGYVPGFNDGDPCNFKIQDPEIIFSDYDYSNIEDIGEDSLDEVASRGNGVFDGWSYEDGTSYRAIWNKTEKLIDLLPLHLLNLMFGDNFHLTITKESFIKGDYECGY